MAKVIRKKRTKKITRKVSKKKVGDFTVKDIRPADYNPREFDDDAKKGLKKSMNTFQDISGITWNKTTTNIVTGHHRWAHLLDTCGEENLSFEHLKGDKYVINANGEDTGYILRVVEWDLVKEKAANVTANSHKIAGQFTADLKIVMEDIKLEMDELDFGELRLDDLSFEMDYLTNDKSKSAGGDDWDSDIDAVKKVDESDQQMYSNITITCKVEDKLELWEAIKVALKGREFDLR